MSELNESSSKSMFQRGQNIQDLPDNRDIPGANNPNDEARISDVDRSWGPAVSQPAWGMLDESLYVDPFTGSCSFRVPLLNTPGRNGFSPKLVLEYNSGTGNGLFGFGWTLKIPEIARSTKPELPRYRDIDDDQFEFDGSALVQSLRSGVSWVDDRFSVGEYVVTRFRRQCESNFERIELWVHEPSGQSHWRVVDANNVTSIFGSNDESRICDPTDSARILKWLISETYDDRGNIIRYSYKREDLDCVDLSQLFESHRESRHDVQGGARYIKKIEYGNCAPHDRSSWLYTVVFDYGEHASKSANQNSDLNTDSVSGSASDSIPTIEETGPWNVRGDPYSDYSGGFEVRVWRLCQRMLMFHSFDELGNEPQLVSSTDMQYEVSDCRSILTSLSHTGYIFRDDSVQSASLPALNFSYQARVFDDEVRRLDEVPVLDALTEQDSGACWIDLNDDGLPDIASRLGGGWIYAANQGAGRFGQPQPVDNTARLDLTDQATIDLRDSATSVVHPARFKPLAVSRTTANANQDDPYIGYIDLNGDNAKDVIVADENVIRWYPSEGEDGFGESLVVRLDGDDLGMGRLLKANARESFHVADMTGDGQFDLVRVRSGEVCYWPNLGRGRFSTPVVMGLSPVLPKESSKESIGRVLLVDLGGNGAADMVWVGDGEIRYWMNDGGNCFRDAHKLTAPGVHPTNSPATAIDIFGRGLPCLLWLDRSAGAPTLRYVAPVQSRPNLLTAVSNSRGAEKRIAYASSAKFLEHDRALGRDWLCRINKHVQLVERVETRDVASNVRDLASYTYHHGHSDSDTEMPGFAFVEIRHSGKETDYAGPGLFPDRDVPAIERSEIATRTLEKIWMHTGAAGSSADSKLDDDLAHAYFNDGTGRRRFLSSDHYLPDAKRLSESEAFLKALRGRELRYEVYGFDGDRSEHVPYLVNETRWAVQLLQPTRAPQAPCCDVFASEKASLIYERNAADPRVLHHFVMSRDQFGNTLRSAKVAYARTTPQCDAQSVSEVDLVEKQYFNQSDQPTWYRVRVPIEKKSFRLLAHELSLLNPATVESIHEMIASNSDRMAQSRNKQSELSTIGMHGWRRYRYWSNDLSRVLPFSEVESKALLARCELAAFDDADFAHHYKDRVTDDLLKAEGGYVYDESLWWAPEETTIYDAGHFYLPVGKMDALGHTYKFRYDRYDIFVEEEQDAYGNSRHYVGHMRAMRLWQTIDENNDAHMMRFDALGVTLARATVGDRGEFRGDVLAAGLSEASSADDPTCVITHSLANASESHQEVFEPGWIRVRSRTQHGAANEELADHYTFVDGSSRVLWRASWLGTQWLISDLVALDTSGQVIRKAEAFYCETHCPDVQMRNEALHAGWLIARDAFGRIIRTDNPDKTFTLCEYKSWQRADFDENDTVRDSEWYTSKHASSAGKASEFANRAAAGRHYSGRAAAMSAANANTPREFYFDVWGRVATERVSRGKQSGFVSTNLDARGRVIQSLDTTGRITFERRFDLAGREIVTQLAGQKPVISLFSASGEVLRKWMAHVSVRYRYDAKGRTTHVYVDDGNGERLAQRFVWGDGALNVSDATQRGLMGRLHMAIGDFGLIQYNTYDLNGCCTDYQIHTLRPEIEKVDWSAIDEVVHADQIVQLLSEESEMKLGHDVINVHQDFDAISRELHSIGPHKAAVQNFYDNHGRLEAVAALIEESQKTQENQAETAQGDSPVVAPEDVAPRTRRRAIVQGVRYDGAGRPVVMRLGRQLNMRRTHNEVGQCAQVMVTSQGIDGVVFEQSAGFDANGNILSIAKGGQLAASFSYDNLGNVVKCEGILPVDGQNNRIFNEMDSFDLSRNRIGFKHRVLSNGESSQFEFDEWGRLVSYSTGESSFDYQYDDNSNLTSIADTQFVWNESCQLMRVLGPGVDVHYRYDHRGELLARIAYLPDGNVVEDIYLDTWTRQRVYNADAIVLERSVRCVGVDGITVAEVEWSLRRREDGEMQAGFAINFKVADHFGSSIVDIDREGHIRAERLYLPDGRAIDVQASPNSSATLATLHRGFMNAMEDQITGLVFINQSWYSPILGRNLNPHEALNIDAMGNVYVPQVVATQSKRQNYVDNPLQVLADIANEVLDDLTRR